MKASECKEIWKSVCGFSNYEVSTCGRVRSKQRTANTWFGKRKVNSKILNTRLNKGYLYVLMRNDENHLCNMKIHRLVATAFIENPNNLPQINHKDENKQNNNINNLEWCTAKYNSNYGAHIDRMKITKKNSSKNKKCVIQYDSTGKQIAKFVSIREAGRILGLDSSCISKCCKGIIKNYKNYIFRYG